MKKLLSVLLALTMALSMGIMSFAADVSTPTPEEAGAAITDWFNSPDVQKFFEDAGTEIKKALENPEEIAAKVDEFIAKAAETLGVNPDDIDQQIKDSDIMKQLTELFAGVKVTTAAPQVTTVEETKAEETIVDTGSAAGGLAIFAVLSLAAAAAFVCKKN